MPSDQGANSEADPWSAEASAYGFYVRLGLDGPLRRCLGDEPLQAVAACLLDGASVRDGERAWVWRAQPVRPDLDRTESVETLGPVGEPRVFEVGVELTELLRPDQREWPQLPGPQAGETDVVVTDGEREPQPLVHVLVDGASVCGYEAERVPDHRDAGCSLDEADRLATCRACLEGRHGLLVKTSPEVLVERKGVVHVVRVDGPLCGFLPGTEVSAWPDLPLAEGHSWCSLEDAFTKGTCRPCREAAGKFARALRGAGLSRPPPLLQHGPAAGVLTGADVAASSPGNDAYAGGAPEVTDKGEVEDPLPPGHPLTRDRFRDPPEQVTDPGSDFLTHIWVDEDIACDVLNGKSLAELPRGHMWTPIDEVDKANCPKCLAEVGLPEVTDPAQADSVVHVIDDGAALCGAPWSKACSLDFVERATCPECRSKADLPEQVTDPGAVDDPLRPPPEVFERVVAALRAANAWSRRASLFSVRPLAPEETEPDEVPRQAFVLDDDRVLCFYADARVAEYPTLSAAQEDHPETLWESTGVVFSPSDPVRESGAEVTDPVEYGAILLAEAYRQAGEQPGSEQGAGSPAEVTEPGQLATSGRGGTARAAEPGESVPGRGPSYEVMVGRTHRAPGDDPRPMVTMPPTGRLHWGGKTYRVGAGELAVALDGSSVTLDGVRLKAEPDGRIVECVFHPGDAEFVVSFAGGRRVRYPLALVELAGLKAVQFASGSVLEPSDVARCSLAQTRHAVVVHLVDGAEATFSGDEVLRFVDGPETADVSDSSRGAERRRWCWYEDGVAVDGSRCAGFDVREPDHVDCLCCDCEACTARDEEQSAGTSSGGSVSRTEPGDPSPTPPK